MNIKNLFFLMAFVLAFSFTGNAQSEGTVDTEEESKLTKTTVSDPGTNMDIPVITLDESELGGTSMGDQNVSSILGASRDPFFSIATFGWSFARFKMRGYDSQYWENYMNGAPIDYIDNGFGAYSLWSGLNDVTRNRTNYIGIKSNPLTFGALGGTYSIDTRASKQRKQLSVATAFSNRTYTNRMMITYGSGITKKGWAFAASLTGRLAKEGYVDGTNYQSLSYFLSIEKVMAKNSISLTAFGAPTKNGKTTPVEQQFYDLAGSHYYNPNWGWQDGKKRNAREGYRHQPVINLMHEWKPSDSKNLTTALSYSFGENSTSGLDWYNAPDPRPQYYKNLPTYSSDPVQQALIAEMYRNNPDLLQVQWDKLYESNRSHVDPEFGSGRSVYALKQDVKKIQRVNLNTVYNQTIKDNTELTAGLNYQFMMSKNYAQMKDLLGGDFWVDINRFAQFNFPKDAVENQNNADSPDRKIKVGDKYEYNVNLYYNKTGVWGQLVHHFNKLDVFVAAEYSNSTYWRKGNYRSGLFMNNSFGKSKTLSFHNYGVKGGLTYKINGKNYLFANGFVQTQAPMLENVFVSFRTRDYTIDKPQNEKIYSVEAGYVLNSPKVRLKATGFYTKINDGTDLLRYYDELVYNFVNVSIQNIDKTYYGGELGMEAYIYKGFGMTAGASIGKYTYSSRWNTTTYVDNTQEVILPNNTVYTKNYYIGGTPQQAYSLGLNYRSPKYWFITSTVNFVDRTFTEISPSRRTAQAVDLVDYKSDLWNSIVSQERINPKGVWTLDIFGGYSWRLKNQFKGLKKEQYLVLNVGINNITNNKKAQITAFEQLRFDVDGKDLNLFKNRYAYAYGINYFISLAWRMY